LKNNPIAAASAQITAIKAIKSGFAENSRFRES
jgi:hypothetical protein